MSFTSTKQSAWTLGFEFWALSAPKRAFKNNEWLYIFFEKYTEWLYRKLKCKLFIQKKKVNIQQNPKYSQTPNMIHQSAS